VKELWESQQKTVFKTKTIKNIAHQHTEATFRGAFRGAIRSNICPPYEEATFLNTS